jgi:hypothetical protein
VRTGADVPKADDPDVAKAAVRCGTARIVKALVSQMRFRLGAVAAADGFGDACIRLRDINSASGDAAALLPTAGKLRLPSLET